jgi:aminopeptidase N
MFKKLFPAIAVLASLSALAQQGLYNPSIDVQHYEFNVRLSDTNDSIIGHAAITVRFTEKTNTVNFDLANVNDTGKGMLISAVKENNTDLPFTHSNNTINITLAKDAIAGEVKTFDIFYKGIPFDGLIFSKNKFKHRTIFADNWPNRARNWIPCKDHLSDKASVDFIVTAPDHFLVISNGIKTEEKDLASHLHLTHWKEEVPLPTKIMVIGLADFAVDYPGDVNGIPVSSWVFPEQRESGFYDYSQALEILPFYIKNIGTYSYQKLANVQSKTIFGGMENASAIFYAEKSITGKRKMEDLLAHEIAHQWFGDAATETDWPQLWLSEGFATAMTHLYLESKYGRDSVTHLLQRDRTAVIAFAKRSKKAVVDTSAGRNPMAMLNTNSYEKGGWVLYMLRDQLGDSIFWKGIRAYYAAYRGKNASTADLQKVFEQVSGKSLQTFFSQWLYTPENPALHIGWQYNEETKEVAVTVTQKTNYLFSIPLEVGFMDAAGNKTNRSLNINETTGTFHFPLNSRPVKMQADPRCRLLFEEVK